MGQKCMYENLLYKCEWADVIIVFIIIHHSSRILQHRFIDGIHEFLQKP
jgi:hypothetical protein